MPLRGNKNNKEYWMPNSDVNSFNSALLNVKMNILSTGEIKNLLAQNNLDFTPLQIKGFKEYVDEQFYDAEEQEIPFPEISTLVTNNFNIENKNVPLTEEELPLYEFEELGKYNISSVLEEDLKKLKDFPYFDVKDLQILHDSSGKISIQGKEELNTLINQLKEEEAHNKKISEIYTKEIDEILKQKDKGC